MEKKNFDFLKNFNKSKLLIFGIVGLGVFLSLILAVWSLFPWIAGQAQGFIPDGALKNSLSASGSGGQQIIFKVKGDGYFNDLAIEGVNQNGDWVRWQSPFTSRRQVDITTNWWWKETVVVTFTLEGVGRRSCVIDYLKEGSGGSVTVTYLPGGTCDGEGGSTAVAQQMTMLIEYMDYKDSYQVLAQTKGITGSVDCLNAIAEGLAGQKSVISVGWKCKNVAIKPLNDILKKYRKQIDAQQ